MHEGADLRRPEFTRAEISLIPADAPMRRFNGLQLRRFGPVLRWVQQSARPKAVPSRTHWTQETTIVCCRALIA